MVYYVPPTWQRGLSMGIALLAIGILVLIYGFASWQKSGKFFGFSPYKTVDLIDLLSFGNLYNGKKVCSSGYYVQNDQLSILKVSLSDSEFARSTWVNNPTGAEIITKIPGQGRMVEVTICGVFESHRAGEFSEPPIWNHQLTVEKFETYGESEIINNF